MFLFKICFRKEWMQAWWENVILIGIEMALKIWNWHRVQFANFPDQFSHLTFAKCAFVKSVYFIRRSLFFVSQIGKKVKVSFSERKVCKTCPGLSSNYWGFWDRFTSSHPLLFPSFLPASTPPAKKSCRPKLWVSSPFRFRCAEEKKTIKNRDENVSINSI